jgi:DNA-binding NtrC family response regulator
MDEFMETHNNRPVVLIADDEVMVRNIARITLERQGYAVLIAENGAEALSLSRHYQGHIDVLLSDFEMPKMNGLELGRHVCSERPDTLVLLMSGSENLPQITVPFIRKPFGPIQLTEKIRELLAQSR